MIQKKRGVYHKKNGIKVGNNIFDFLYRNGKYFVFG